MNLSRNARRAGLILAMWLIAIVVSLVVVPRLPAKLPTWLPWAVVILLGTIGKVNLITSKRLVPRPDPWYT
ncbi:MAG: hypothetical protein ACE5HA_00600 [Anaerolineae bacterium]